MRPFQVFLIVLLPTKRLLLLAFPITYNFLTEYKFSLINDLRLHKRMEQVFQLLWENRFVKKVAIIIVFFIGLSLLRIVTWCKYTLHSLSPPRSVLSQVECKIHRHTQIQATWSHHRYNLRPLGRLPSILPVTINH